MDINVERRGFMTVLVPVGELHREESNAMTAMLEGVIVSDATTVVISFRDVTALLSEGIRCLINLRDRVIDSGRDFYISELPHVVKYTLKISNLLEFLNYRDSLDEIEVKQPDPAVLEKLKQEKMSAEERPTESKGGKPESAGKPEEFEPVEKHKKKPRTYHAFGSGSHAHKDESDLQGTAKPVKPVVTEQTMQKLITRHLPGRLAVEIVEYFILRHINVASVASIASEIGAKERVVARTAKELVMRGVLKELGRNTFNYAPRVELDEQIKELVHQWHKPSQQPRILAMLLSAER